MESTTTLTTAISVPASRLRLFEPVGLGTLFPRFQSLVLSLRGKRQTEITRLLEAEATTLERDISGQSLAYCTSLLILRDYITFGYYPVASRGHCYLAPVLETPSLDDNSRRAIARRLFAATRNRALAERDHLSWLERAVDALRVSPYDASLVLADLAEGPPQPTLTEARTSKSPTDPRGLWRCVRTTWSMSPDSSAPGREVAFLVADRRHPETPLGIFQLRNVVPEIDTRDRWLGIRATVAASGGPEGYLARIIELPAETKDRLEATLDVFQRLRRNVNKTGLPSGPIDDSAALLEFARSERRAFDAARKEAQPDARIHLFLVKRAETAGDLSRGIRAITEALSTADPAGRLIRSQRARADLNAGLRKTWHYHMGFVAIEMSVCGAAPPFGPVRIGKLIASLPASSEVRKAWGAGRPLGEIARNTFLDSVRDEVPNPGPLVIFTSGLYSGHSAQYNRVRIGDRRWEKIGDTQGFGSFHISLGTTRAVQKFNRWSDGYDHVSRKFGEGSGPRFRSVGRALARLDLPDLLHHEMSRPLYGLKLASDPCGVLFGWAEQDKGSLLSSQELAETWWNRWVASNASKFVAQAQGNPDLPAELASILKAADATC